MNTRKVRAGMPAPDDIPWPEPEPEPEPEDDVEKIQSQIVGTLFLSACMVVLVVLWVLFA